MEQYMTEETLKRIMDLESLADKRLELLKEIEPHLTTCPVCLKGMVNQRIHTDDCELAEAIAEE